MADIAELGLSVDSKEVLSATDALKKIQDQAAKTESATNKLTNGIGLVGRASASLTNGLGNLKTSLIGVGAGMLAAFGITAIIANLSQISEKIDAISKSATKLNASMGDIQALALAADLAGIEFGAFDSAMQKMNRTLGTAIATGKGQEGVFKMLGVSAQDLVAMPIAERMGFLGDKMNSLGLSSEQTALVLGKLGDRAGSLTPLMEGGAAAILEAKVRLEEFHGVLADNQGPQVEAMNDAFTSLGYAIQAVGVQLIGAIAPLLGPIIEGIATTIGVITGAILTMVSAISSNIETIATIGGVLLLAFGPAVLMGLNLLLTIISGAFVTALGMAATATLTLLEVLWSLALANPISAMVAVAVLAIAGLIAYFPAVADAARAAVNWVVGAFVGGFNLIKTIWNNFGPIMKYAFDVAVDAGLDGMNTIKAAFLGGYEAIKTIWDSFGTFMAGAVMVAVNAFINGINKIIKSSIEGINSLINKFNAASSLLKVPAIPAIGTGRFNITPYIDPKAAATVGVLTEATEAYNKTMMDATLQNSMTLPVNGNEAAANVLGTAMKQLNDDIGVDYISNGIAGIKNLTTSLTAGKPVVDETKKSTADLGAGLGSMGDAAKKASEELTELQTISKGLDAISAPFDQAKSAFDKLKEMHENGIITGDAYTAMLGRIQTAFTATGGTAEQFGNIITEKTDTMSKQLTDLAEGAMEKLGDAFVELAFEGEFNFAELAKSILKDMMKIMVQAMIIKPIMASFGFADGGAFGAGVTPFASGGTFTNNVVNKPTPFAFANGGALGVMGEAGPEAIMPLKRGADGSLGVQMHGGGTGGKGGNSFTMGDINVTTQSGTGDKQQDDAQAGRVAESVKDAIHHLIDERMFGSRQYGGAFNPRGM